MDMKINALSADQNAPNVLRLQNHIGPQVEEISLEAYNHHPQPANHPHNQLVTSVHQQVVRTSKCLFEGICFQDTIIMTSS